MISDDERGAIKRDIKLANIDFLYHKKQMEYHQDKIEILEGYLKANPEPKIDG